MMITGTRPTVADPPPIPLPPTPDGTRAQKRREMLRRRRRRGASAAALVLVVALVAAAAVVLRDTGSGGGGDGQSTDTPTATGVAVPPVLVAEQAPDGSASWLTEVVPAPDGTGGSLLLIPSGTMAEVPSLGLEPVGAALAAGGPERLLTTTENLIGASLGTVDVLNADGLAQLLAATGPLVVNIPERVEDVFPSGRVAVLFEAGRSRVEPAEVSRLLSAAGRSSALSRLGRHQAFWEAWLERIKQTPNLAPDGALGKALRAIASGSWNIRVVPVKSAGTLGGGQQIYQLDRDALPNVLRTVFPGAAKAAATRPRVRVLNGTGELELAQRVSEKLVPAGIEVTLTGNANPLGQLQTQVIYYDADKRAMAEKVRAALGVGILVRNRNATDVVDVTVIVGKDFPTK
ncbi:MAG: hypothetical protein QOG87_1025 [Actinomycetota bacterium]|jgi:hypothetical protein